MIKRNMDVIPVVSLCGVDRGGGGGGGDEGGYFVAGLIVPRHKSSALLYGRGWTEVTVTPLVRR